MTGTLLLVALLAACAYAAFAGGAARLPEETWLQVALVLLGVAAATAWLAGALRPAASPLALGGLALLVGLGVWTGVSLVWSVTPDRTWLELNRVLGYALVVAVALAAAAGARGAIARVAVGWLVIATAVALYALAGKLAPGVVDHASVISRLRAPLEYWNALGLVCALAVPVGVRVATARDRHAGWRLAALVALLVLVTCIGLTYSRGAVVAALVALVVVTVVGGARLPGLAVVGLVAVAAAPVLGFAYTRDALTDNAAPLGERIDAGLVLLAVLAGAALLLAAAGWALLRVETRATWSRAASVRTWRLLAILAAALVAGAITALAASDRGLGGSVEHAADTFTETRRDPIYDPGRLLTTSSGNRWAWWREALGAWSDEPALGWGAGSFPVSRRLYRVTQNDVQQVHSLPLQWLTELGVVGAVLGLGALLALLAAAIARVRSLASGRDRDLAGALLAAALAWTVHACLDWDWDIPGVTLPVLLFLGVLGARAPAPRGPAGLDESPWGRVLGLAAAGLLACAVLVSAALPALSDGKAGDALRASEGGGPERLEQAAADAELAASLDPLAVRPLFAAAAVAERRERLLEARGHLLDAVERQPYSLEAWTRLTRVALALADRAGVERASTRALELDPGDLQLIRFVNRSQGLLAPPEASATATGTPLPAGP